MGFEPVVIESIVEEGTDNQNVGQVAKPDGTFILEADVPAGWALDVYEKANSVPIYSLAGQSTSGVIFDTPQLDGFWGIDDIGYNFRHPVTQVALATQSASLEGGRRYLFLYQFPTMTEGILVSRFIWRIRGGPRF